MYRVCVDTKTSETEVQREMEEILSKFQKRKAIKADLKQTTTDLIKSRPEGNTADKAGDDATSPNSSDSSSYSSSSTSNRKKRAAKKKKEGEGNESEGQGA